MRVSRFGSRATGLGLVCALAGFAFAVSTGQSQSESIAAAPRAIGSYVPLRFTTPHLLDASGNVLNPLEYDLGDALFGSVITRFVTAEGGIKPYRFTTVGTQSLPNVIANTTSTLKLGISGVVAGKTPDTVAPNSTTFVGAPGLRFQVTVTDSILAGSTAQSGFFNLALFSNATTPFRFANDTIPAASLDAPYFARADVLAGRGTIAITALSATDMGTGMPVKLATLGIFLGSDGSFYGRPLAVGTYSITVRATDAFGSIALSRANPNAFDQTFTLVVNDNPVTSSDTMTQSCSVSGDTAQGGADSLRLKGLINVLGQDQFSLANSDFSFHLGNIAFAGRLDGHGNLTQIASNGSKFSVKISARTGTITIMTSRGTFINGFDLTGIKNGDVVRRPIQIVVGEAVNSVEVLDFAASVDGTRYQFNFMQGRSGQNASGGFQIVSVKGRDGVALNGQPGDAWHVGFVAQPRAGVTNPSGLREGIDNITAVNVRIGTNFAQAITGGGIIGAGPNIHFVGGPVDGLQSFKLSTISSKGLLNTRILSTASTSIPLAADALKTNNIFFTLGIDVRRASADATYIGEHARRIFGFGTKYTDKPSARQSPPIQ